MEYLIKRPMFLCAVVSSVASIAGFYSKTALFLLGIGVIIVLSVTLYKRVSVYSIVWFLVLITVFSAFLQLAEIEKIKYFSGNECRGEYIVVTEPVARGDYYSVTVEVERSEILKKGTKIDVIYSEQGVGYSDIIMSDITIKSIEDSEYKSMNYSEKIYCNGYMKNIENTGKKDFVLKKLGGLRKYIKTKIFKNFEFNESATALALVTSDKSYFSDEFYSNVKASGVAHVMVFRECIYLL